MTNHEIFQKRGDAIAVQTRQAIAAIDAKEASGELSASEAFGRRHSINRSYDRRIDRLTQEMFGSPSYAADLMMDIAFSSQESQS